MRMTASWLGPEWTYRIQVRTRDDRYSSIARLRAVGPFGGPKIRALFEATYFVGLRKAGMPEE
jgi:hypothetical protein